MIQCMLAATLMALFATKGVNMQESISAPASIQEEVISKLSGDHSMEFTKEKVSKKFVIGMMVRTSNETFLQDSSALRTRVFSEGALNRIPHRTSSDILCIYTDYEGDYTKPFTYIIGVEVSSLDTIPEGMMGIEIPTQNYAKYTAKGEFPQSMLRAWQAIWKSNLQRAYTSDFEVYKENFNPQNKPEIDIYIAIPR